MDLGDFNPVRVLAGKGEIGKSGLGSTLATLALNYFAPGLGSLEAAGIVGGSTALASGSLKKGLMAGIGAYGTSELLGGAEKGIADAAAERLQGSESFANNFADQIGLSRADLAAPATPLTSGEQFKAGLSALKKMPTKELLQYGAMAAAPILTAQSQQGMPSNTTNPNAYIRPKVYDHVTHRYYDLPAIKAGEMGSQSIADYVNSQVAPARAARGGLMAAYANGGFATVGSDGAAMNQNPNPASGPAGQLAYNNEPVMRMAEGGRIEDGVRRFDIGGENAAALRSAYSSGSDNLQSLVNSMGVTQADVDKYFPGFNVNAAGLSLPGQTAAATPIAATPAASGGGGGGGGAGLQALAPAVANLINTGGGTASPSMIFPVSGSEAAGAQRDALIKSGIDSGTAEAQAFNNYAAGLAKNYYDPTATQKGSGTLGVYQDLMKAGLSPAVFSAAEKAINPDWGKTGTYWNPDTVAKAYQVADKVLQFDPLTDKVTPSDKEWVVFMDKNNISTKDISIATGLSQNEVDRRYAAAKATPVTTTTVVPPITKITGDTTGGVVPGGTQLPTATTYDNGAYGNYGSGNKTGVDYLGNTVSIATPGDIITNPDQTRTVVSNIPGRPRGAFSGVGEVTSAFTAGGGHLGQVLKPTKTYQNTGGSKAAYDYLSGLGTTASTKTQPDIKPKNTYSNFNAPSADEIKQFSKYAKVYKDGVPVDNPYYNKGNIIDSNAPVANLINQVSNDAGGGLAGGGLSALAHGGMSDGHLGGYSDGGRLLRGPGDGVSDSIPATIAGKQPARLADGEFVVPARIVSEIGNGSTEAGARKLYAMMDRVQSARGKTVGKGRVAKNTRADKYLPA